MDRYNVNHLIKVKLESRNFREFRDAIRREFRVAQNSIKPHLTKDKDIRFMMESYLKVLGKVVYSLDSGILNNPPYIDNSVSEVMRPIVEHYVNKGDLPLACLQVLEPKP